MKEKLLHLFFIFNVIFIGNGLFSHAFAQNVWDGKTDISWYNASDKSFEISTAEQLAGFASLVNDGNSFRGITITLKNDLILNKIEDADDWLSDPSGNEWIAIGTSSKPFKGTFDGNKCTISGLYGKTKRQYNGLFGAVDNAVIKNLGLVNFYLNGNKYNGGIAGYSNKSDFENVYSRGKIVLKGNENIGGLIGHAVDSDFESVSSHISIITDGKLESVGGLIGNCEESDIKNAYTIGEITNKSSQNSSNIGGIIGYNKKTNINSAYTVCKISVKGNTVGGLAGYLTGTNNIQKCYYNTDAFDGEWFGKNSGGGLFSIYGEKSDELRKLKTFKYWDFENIWAISASKNDGYPYLLMEEGGNPPIEYPDILHVKEKGNDTKDGSDWENAITLSKALEVLNKRTYDAKRLRINIAKGDYRTQGEAFLIKNNVLIYGGFDDVDNSAAKNTILHGGDNNRVLIIYNKENLLNVTIEGLKIMKGTAHDEVKDITLSSGETSKYRGGGIFNANANTTLNEVVITENVAGNETSTYTAMGGGIYNHSGKLTLKNCLVGNNVAANMNSDGKGGGIYLNEGTAETTIYGGSVISENMATKGTGSGSGGGIYISKGSTDVHISKSSIIKNIAINNADNESAAQGGGIYNEKRNIVIDTTKITHNTATIGKGNGSGGGIYHPFLLDPENQITITLDNSEISENIAFKNTNFVASSDILKGSGGGIYFGEGSIVFYACKLQKNTAAYANVNETVSGNGGAVYNVAGRLIMEACEVLENTATNAKGNGYGGGISNASDNEVKLFNTLIAKNAAGDQALGGGIYNTTGKDVTLTNVTIAGNTAGQKGVAKRNGDANSVGGGSGIYNFEEGHITVENTIVWNNQEEDGIVQYLDDGATHFGGYCFISDHENSAGHGDTITLNGKNRAIDYPKFVEPQSHNYRLKAASPLRNLALKEYIDDGKGIWNEPDKDLDNNERVKRSLDLGAYESSPLSVTLTNSVNFGYNIPDSLEKYGVIAPTEYEVDPNSSFVFALRVDPGIVYNAVVKANGQECKPGTDDLYTIPDITEDTQIEVQFTADKYTVTMPKVEGVITEPVADNYQVESGKDFIFSLKLEDGYNQSIPVVKANGTIITATDGKYSIRVSSNVEITIEEVKPNEYTVKIPQVTGLSTNPAAGNYTVKYDGTFDFTVTKKQGYENLNLSISTDQNYYVETVDAALGKYRIKKIKHDINISMALTQNAVYKVTLKTISDIQTTPKAGQYSREDGESFGVTFVIPEKYEVDDIIVDLNGNSKTFSHVSGNTYSYTITNIKKNHVISIEKNKRFEINLNKTDGVVFDPSAGMHNVGKYDDFSFTITLEKNYDQSTFKVYANNSLINPIQVKDGTYTYRLSSVQKDYDITVEGVEKNDDVANEDIDGKIKVYANNKTLFVRTNEVALLTIYTLNGQIHTSETIPAGTTKVQLPSGVYIVKVNDEIFKVII